MLSSFYAPQDGTPNVTEYPEKVKVVNAKASEIYRYMNFDKIAEFKELAETVTV